MKIVIVGATGTIGLAVTKKLESKHELICVSHTSGEHKVDITQLESIKHMYQEIEQFDALIITTGKTPFEPIAKLTEDDLYSAIESKLMGQVNLVLEGLKHVNPNGSFTLTSGILNQKPIIGAVPAATVNGGLEGFVRGAAIDMPKQTRINIVSPTILTESAAAYGTAFEGFSPVDADKVAQAYADSVEGSQTGQVIKVGW